MGERRWHYATPPTRRLVRECPDRAVEALVRLQEADRQEQDLVLRQPERCPRSGAALFEAAPHVPRLADHSDALRVDPEPSCEVLPLSLRMHGDLVGECPD